MTAAIDGSNYDQCRSFEVATTATSTAEALLAGGSYEVCCTQDCYLKLGATGMSAAVALPATQPAAGSPNRLIRLYASQRIPLDINNAVTYFRALRVSADGVLTFNGPLAQSVNP